jgi:hypothetical protein
MTRFHLASAAIFLFWYVSLFPGRLGFDYSQALRMIQRGESTDWWGASFFWFLRLTTFWGQELYLSSFLTYGALFLSLRYFVFSLPGEARALKITFLISSSLPIVSVFGLTVSHDAFQVAGILLLTGFSIRNIRKIDVSFRTELMLSTGAYLMLITTKIGVVIVVIDLLIKLFKREFLTLVVSGVLIGLIYSVSGIGVNKYDPSSNTAWLVADLKCVAQHPEARLSSNDWKFLQGIAPKKEWLERLSCTTVDDPVGSLQDINRESMRLNSSFIQNYISITKKNPSIVAMAHVQRSRGALPPPFFQGPDNQVELNTKIPIGEGTNIALQNSFAFLHPSIDEPSVDIQVSMLKPLELFAQGLMFFFNQASWFWGWGGMWLWPALYYFMTRFSGSRNLKRIEPLIYLATLHVMLFLIAPGPMARYVMASTITGITLTILLILEWNSSNQRRMRFEK